MATKEDMKRQKQVANRMKKRAAALNRTGRFVASFTMDGKVIQQERFYNSKAEIKQDHEDLAYIHAGGNVNKIGKHEVDNGTAKEKKESGDNKNKPSSPVQELNNKPPGNYKAMSKEKRLQEYDRISIEQLEHKKAGLLMADRHKKEKKAWEKVDNDLQNQQFALKAREGDQADLFNDTPKPTPAPGMPDVKFINKKSEAILESNASYKDIDAVKDKLKMIAKKKKIKKDLIRVIQQQEGKGPVDITAQMADPPKPKK